MTKNRTRKWIWIILMALVILAGLALGGAALYRAGYNQGVTENFSWPEGAEVPMVPHGVMPYRRSIGPRVGLLGLLPLLCFGGFFFLLLMGCFSFFTRRRAWIHNGPGTHHDWKHHCPPPPWWGSGKTPHEQEKPSNASAEPEIEAEDPEA